jgi:dipeptidyl-peptidase 4
MSQAVLPRPPRSPWRVAPFLLLSGSLMQAEAAPDAPKPSKPLDAATVAKRPAPGTVVPGGIEFTHDGKAVVYLKSEANSLDRVLWRADVDGKTPPKVVARPPGTGNTDANVSPEEALRRERMRQVDTGITSAVRAQDADVTVFPLNGDLYLQRGTGPLERLTDTEAPELDPRPSPDGTKVAFVRDRELYVLDLATKKETRLSPKATDTIAYGLAEFMAQEEMDRHTGYWWSPDGKQIAYQETDERPVALFSIVHDGAAKPSVETHRYPFPGEKNAEVRLGVVSVDGGATRWLDFDEPEREFYLARVTWESPSKLLVQRLLRDQKLLKLFRVEAKTGQTTLLLEETSPTWVNLHDDLRTLPGGQFLWSSERSGFKHIELRDKDGDLIRPLSAGDWVDDAIVGVDTKRREVWFTSNAHDPRESGL